MTKKKKRDDYVFEFGSLVVCDFSVLGDTFVIIGKSTIVEEEFLLANEDNIGFFCNVDQLTLVDDRNKESLKEACEYRKRVEDKYPGTDLEKMGYLVELTYFKNTGKYYSIGGYHSYMLHMHEIYQEVRELKELGKLPGLVNGAIHFIVLINVPDHEDNVPHLIL